MCNVFRIRPRIFRYASDQHTINKTVKNPYELRNSQATLSGILEEMNTGTWSISYVLNGTGRNTYSQETGI